MKTRLLIIIGIALTLGMFTTIETKGLSCGVSTLQGKYDYADHVFHGKLISKQHDPAKPSQTTMVFNLQKSFKGIDSEQVSAEFNEGWDKKFEQGYEYIVFAQGSEQPLEIELCGYQYYAFPTIVNIVSQLDDKNNNFGKILENKLYQYLTESEKTQLENLSESYAIERQQEREVFFGKAMLLGIPAAIGAGVIVMWVKTLKSK